MNNLRPFFNTSRAGNLSVWDEPIPGKDYIIGIDVAEGKEKDIGQRKVKKSVIIGSDDRPDYSSATVIEKEHGLHVASWHGYMDPPEFARCCAALGIHYNNALLVPERNGPGLAVISILVDVISYSPIYRSRVFAKIDRSDFGTTDIGWITSQTSRPLLITRVHEVLNQAELFTRDKDLINELRTMEFDERGTARARNKNKDDRVFSLALALQGRYEMLTGTLGGGTEEEDLRGMDMMSRVAYRHRQAVSKRGTHVGDSGSGHHRFRRYARSRRLGGGLG